MTFALDVEPETFPMPPIPRGGALVLGLCLAACTRTTAVPPTPPTPPPIDLAEVEAELAQAAALLAQAEADGRLSPNECEAVTTAFRATFVAKHSRTAQGLFDAGVVWERCGEPTKAASAYREAIAAAPEHASAHNNLGVLQWKAGDRAQAVASFERAVKADPTAPAPRNNHAAAIRERYLQSGSDEDFTRAELALRNALVLDSDNPVSYENLARLYYDRGRLHERSYLLLAKLVVNQATQVLERRGTKSAELSNLHGLLLMEEGDLVAALRAFKGATEIEPDHAGAHLNVAMIALRFRDYATAEASLEKALRDDRHSRQVGAWLGLGVAQRGLRRYDAAESTLVRAHELDDRDPRALYNLGILYHEHIAPKRSQSGPEGEGKLDDEPYLAARRFFVRFAKAAGKSYPEQVADARLRMTSIDELLAATKALEELQADRDRIEAEARLEREQERLRLLELERRAKQAQQVADEGS